MCITDKKSLFLTIDEVTGPGHCPRKQDSGLRIGHYWHGTLLALVTHDQSQVQDWRQYHNVIFMFWLAYLATAKISQVHRSCIPLIK